LSIDLFSILLLMRHDGLEQAVQVLIARVIVLVKSIKARRQVRAELRRVVILE
jgi:hypothetical protein